MASLTEVTTNTTDRN